MKPFECSTPNGAPVTWDVFRAGDEGIYLGPVTAKWWMAARELAAAKYGLDRGLVDVREAPRGVAESRELTEEEIAVKREAAYARLRPVGKGKR